MRRIKSIKRRDIYVLNVLFLASIFLFYDTHSEVFFKEFAMHKLEGMLPKGAIAEIGNIIHIAQKEDFLDLEVKKEANRFIINGKVNHMNPIKWLQPSNGVKFPDIDFICDVKASIEINRFNPVNCKVVFKNAIINYVPFEKNIEIFLSYDKAKDTVNINKFKIGDEIEGYGYVRLTGPHYVFLKWTITNLDLTNYSVFSEGKGSISGNMFGDFIVKGPIKEPFLVGHMDVQKGSWDDFKFDSFIASLKGKLPLISICDSRIWKEDGYMILGGEIDLAKLKDGKVFDGVSLEPGENFFMWEEWSVMKKSEDSSVKVEKSLDEEFDLTFKAYKKDEESEEGHFLGVEHKVKF
ncbi:MAG: hypothetical protein JSV93_01465 [Candidatus Omnitrophota bacterium]|nr:MAG: hypothetical protein JSV93_01465 [Candidatus Omnitrophota bacterium]